VLAANCQVDSGCTLTINGGCRIYGHPGVFLKVFGTLNIIGQQDSVHHVYFRGDRLEHFYDDVPGKWGGIVFYRGSTANSIDYCVMNEGTQAIVAGIPGNANYAATDYGNAANVPDVTVTHSTIKNFYSNAILAINAKLTFQNCLIFNTGSSAISLGLGGTYAFNGCTVANYGSTTTTHQDPVLSFSNYLVANNVVYTNDLNLAVYNSIIHGNLTSGNEIARDSVTKTGSAFNYVFKNCLLATYQAAPAANFFSCILNQDPQFKNPAGNKFTLLPASPCIGKAATNAPFDDITGYSRGSTPDIGAYQHH
jgi:hypothetical protein